MTHPIRRPSPARRGFTLIELLVVIGIIIVLIGIIVPGIGRMRTAAARVATQSTMNSIAAACDMYFQNTGSYPGVVANNRVATPPDGTYKLDATVTPSEAIHFVNYPNGNPPETTFLTSTENMVISVMGGLRRDTTPVQYTYDFNTIGQGPMSLNNSRPGRTPPTLELRPTDLTSGFQNPAEPNNPRGQWRVSGDCAVPEILDSFSKPNPILYMRANRGADNVLFSSRYDVAGTTPQYDARQLTPYGFPSVAEADAHAAFEAANPEVLDPVTNEKMLAAGEESYFFNHESSRVRNVVVRNRDTYMLISAGPDGKYGTADDLRN